MKITEISYTRKFNLGNYETEDYSITAELSPSELIDSYRSKDEMLLERFNKLKELVNKARVE